MKKSDDLNNNQEIPDLPKVDYSRLPPELEEAISQKPYVRERKGKLSWDGKQFTMRIPSEVANEMGITKEDHILFRLTKSSSGISAKPELEIKLIQEP